MKSIKKAFHSRLRSPEFFPSVKSQPAAHKALRALWLEGIFQTISQAFYASFVPLLVLDVGGAVRHIAQITSLSNLASLAAQLPGAHISESRGKPKATALLTTRAIVPVTLVLFILTITLLQGLPAVHSICAISVLGTLSTAFGSPAYTSLLGELIPMRVRGRYLSSRQVAMSICGLLAVPAAGRIIQSGGFPTGYQISFGLALLAGVTATIAYSWIPEPTGPSERDNTSRITDSWKALLRQRSFLRYCLAGLIWGVGCQLAAPFFAVHMVENLGFSKATIGALSTVSTLASLAAMRVFGPRIDRRGARWVMIASGLLIPFVPWSWLLVQLPWQAALANVLGGFAWGGYNLGALNLLLSILSEEHRGRGVALFNTVGALAAVVGPLVGGVLYTSHGFPTNLILSGAGRLLGILSFIWLVQEPKTAQARERSSPAGHEP